LVTSKREHAPALDKVSADKGYEAALAAALGDDLDAALDARAAAYWAGARPLAVVAHRRQPLASHVQAPEPLPRAWPCAAVAARRTWRLAKALPPGARLVTREGDLWRWDGFVSRAEAPRPAAVRLAQRTRLAELEAEIDDGKPALDQAQAALKAATEAFHAAEEAVKTARIAPFAADKAAAAARDRVESLSRDQARREARAQALDETLARQTAEVEAAQSALTEALSVDSPSETLAGLRDELTAARAAADVARAASGQARSDRDAEARERSGREARLTGLTRERDGWATRSKDAAARIKSLEKDAEKAAALLKQASGAPEALAAQRSKLLDTLTAAETRRKTPPGPRPAVRAGARARRHRAGEPARRGRGQRIRRRLETMRIERADLSGAVGKLRAGIEELNAEGRERLLAAFDVINANFQSLFRPCSAAVRPS
jgi:chromosome segregation protein